MGKSGLGLASVLALSFAACEDSVPPAPFVPIIGPTAAGTAGSWTRRTLDFDRARPILPLLNCPRFLVADFDDDGLGDVLCAGYGFSQVGLFVFYQGPDGRFDTSVHVSASGGFLASGDFDQDGLADVAWLQSGLHVRLARRDRSFSDERMFPAGAATFLNGSPIVVADLDGDAHLDIVHLGLELEMTPQGCYYSFPRKGFAYSYLGDGAGGFSAASPTLVWSSSYAGPCSGASIWGAARILVADLGLDGKADLFVKGALDWQRFPQLGDGTFGSAQPAFAGNDLRFFAHLNGDARIDVVSRRIDSDGYQRNPRLLLSRGKRTVEADVDLIADPVAVEDFGDGPLTTLYLDAAPQNGSTLTAARSGSTAIAATAPHWDIPYVLQGGGEFHVADMNGDGVKDLVFGMNPVQIAYGRFLRDPPPLP